MVYVFMQSSDTTTLESNLTNSNSIFKSNFNEEKTTFNTFSNSLLTKGNDYNKNKVGQIWNLEQLLE
jgi:hypothetical protein